MARHEEISVMPAIIFWALIIGAAYDLSFGYGWLVQYGSLALDWIGSQLLAGLKNLAMSIDHLSTWQCSNAPSWERDRCHITFLLVYLTLGGTAIFTVLAAIFISFVKR